jgi:hypothetical protein
LIVLGACQDAQDDSNKAAVSWAEWFTSLAELKQNSDVCILASVVSINDRPTPHDAPPSRLVEVDVLRLIWTRDPMTSVPAQLTFEQTGGLYGGMLFEAEGDKLISIGETYILFLREYSVGMYRVSGGPTGRFGVSDEGIVRPSVPDGVQLPASTTVDDFGRL